MFYHFSECVASKFVQMGIISSEDYELYRYGFQQGSILILNFISAMMISFICGTFFECIVFLLVFVPLRSYAGGYHAKTHFQCYFYSMLFLAGILLTLKLFLFPTWIYCLFSSFGIFSILMLAPVEDKNKPLDPIENRIYRKRILGILLVVLFIQVMTFLCKTGEVYRPCSFALFSLSILLIVGKAKND